MNANGSIATTSSIAEVMVLEGESCSENMESASAHHVSTAEKDNLSVLESVGSHDED